jgi:hypothetical protein
MKLHFKLCILNKVRNEYILLQIKYAMAINILTH